LEIRVVIITSPRRVKAGGEEHQGPCI